MSKPKSGKVQIHLKLAMAVHVVNLRACHEYLLLFWWFNFALSKSWLFSLNEDFVGVDSQTGAYWTYNQGLKFNSLKAIAENYGRVAS